MKHKEYTKLMKTPFDKLSKEDQQLRTTEFNKRLQLARTFMLQLREGKIDKNFTKLIEDDDPIKELVEILEIKVNDSLGAEA